MLMVLRQINTVNGPKSLMAVNELYDLFQYHSGLFDSLKVFISDIFFSNKSVTRSFDLYEQYTHEFANIVPNDCSFFVEAVWRSST